MRDKVSQRCNTTGNIISFISINFQFLARHAGSDGSMSASGSAGPGFDLRRGRKFSTSGPGGVEMYTL